MDKELGKMRLEELGLDEKIIKKLKEAFIYTVGDLQAKTRRDLENIKSFDNATLSEIEAQLMWKIKRGLSSSVEEGDRLESLNLHPKIFGPIINKGISRISDLKRMSRLELSTIWPVKNTLEKRLNELGEYLGNDRQLEVRQRSTEGISIGHLDISKYTFNSLKSANIYTIGDLQRTTNEQLRRSDEIGENRIQGLEKALSEYGVARYYKSVRDSERLRRLGLDSRCCTALEEQGIYYVTQLSGYSLQTLKDIRGISEKYAMELAEKYLEYSQKKKNSELNKKDNASENGSELEMLKRIKFKLEEIKRKKECQMKTLAEILEELRNANGQAYEPDGENLVVG